MDGTQVWIAEGSPSFVFSTGDIYIENGDGEFVYSESQSKSYKASVNEIIASRRGKVKKRR